VLITTSLMGITATEAFKFSKGPHEKRARLIGIVFCRPDLQLMRTAIIPALPYFHFRSGGNTAFYFGGFESDDEWTWQKEERHTPTMDENTYTSIPGPERRHWYFIPQHFNQFRAEVEQHTRWRYSGGCDMILTNSRYYPAASDYVECRLDFSTSIMLQLDRLSEIPSMPTVGQMFEKVFQYAEDQDPIDPTWGFSDFAGLNIAKSGLWQFLLSFVPESLRSTANAASHLVVHDIALGP
jgi:hypothetical protein